LGFSLVLIYLNQDSLGLYFWFKFIYSILILPLSQTNHPQPPPPFVIDIINWGVWLGRHICKTITQVF